MLFRSNITWEGSVSAGESYSCENFLLGAGGLYNHVQLFLPLLSGKRVELRVSHGILSAAISLNVRRHDVALPIAGPPAPFIKENLLGGGPAPSALMLGDQPVAPVGSPFWLVGSPANTPAVYPPAGREWGFSLLEGQGILFQAAAAVTVIINWQWTETLV